MSGSAHETAPLDAVYRVTLVQEKLAKIGAVLAGDSGDQRDFRFFHDARYCNLHLDAHWTHLDNGYKIQRPAGSSCR